MTTDLAVDTLELPSIDERSVALLNRLIGVERSVGLNLDDEDATLRFESRPKTDRGNVVRVDSPWGQFWLSLDAIAEIAQRGSLEGLQIDRLPRELLPAVLSSAFEKELDALANVTGGECDLLEVATAEGLPDDLQVVGYSLSRPSGDHRGALWASAATLERVADAIAPDQAFAASDSFGALPLEAWVELGMTLISTDELRRVELGDVLLIDVGAPEVRPAGVLRLGPQLAYQVVIEGDSLVVGDRVDSDPGAAPAADALSVRLLFTRGPIRLAAAATASLHAGDSLPFTVGPEVHVRCGAVTLGHGELVEIEGHRGVMMANLSLMP